MAVLAECPLCGKKNSLRNRVCTCSADLVKAKRSKRVRYWIDYRLPDKTQRREPVGYSLEEAKDAEGKRRAQKREGRIFEMLPPSNKTFQELTDWYLDLEMVKALSSFWRKEIALKKFNESFGALPTADIRLTDIENYQQKSLNQGLAPATVDREVGEVKTMIFKAHDDNLINDQVALTFRKVKKTLRRSANARNIILSADDFQKLLSNSPPHLMAILVTGFYTGMRKREILRLTWDKVDLEKGLISLEAKDTKDKEARSIPICDELQRVLTHLPRALHHKYVFTYKGNPITNSIRRSLATACRKSGIPYGRSTRGGIVFHDLRHTFNTYMRKAGVPESVIMKITGHSTREMFDRYNTVDSVDVKNAISELANFVLLSKITCPGHNKR